MAGIGSVKLIKKLPSPQQQFKFIQDQIKRELVPVAQAHVDEREKVVSDWETEVKFGYRISTSEKQVTLSIVVENENEQVNEGGDFPVGALWKSIDKTGVRPHTIKAKNAPRLAFRTGYQPHTRPIGKSGGPGAATGQFTRPLQVEHPGYPPRKFSQVINKKLDKRFRKAIDRGMRLGARKRR